MAVVKSYFDEWFGPDHQYVLDILKEMVQRCDCMFIRLVGEHQSGRHTFLRAFPDQMMESIDPYSEGIRIFLKEGERPFRFMGYEYDDECWTRPTIKVLGEMVTPPCELNVDRVKRYLSNNIVILKRKLYLEAPMYCCVGCAFMIAFVTTNGKNDGKERENHHYDRTLVFVNQFKPNPLIESTFSFQIVKTYILQYIDQYGRTKWSTLAPQHWYQKPAKVVHPHQRGGHLIGEPIDYYRSWYRGQELDSDPRHYSAYLAKQMCTHAKTRMVTSGLAEELMKNRFHPRHMDKWASWGHEDEHDFA